MNEVFKVFGHCGIIQLTGFKEWREVVGQAPRIQLTVMHTRQTADHAALPGDHVINQGGIGRNRGEDLADFVDTFCGKK